MTAKNLTTDQIALVQFKDQIVDPQNALTNNWTSSSSVCEWVGVSYGVIHERVTALNLSNMDLTGPIPSSIFNMSSLEDIILSNNNLSDSLPDDLCHHLPKLETLHSTANELYGNIPSSIDQVHGKHPSTLDLQSNLLHFFISDNVLVGEIPSTICNFSSLTAINLSKNKLAVLGIPVISQLWK
ncbi:hypothetical protein F3Y22_tig00116944pilonHSYRG00190 [Hibiscus syriacus]|uniref:Leucine-rich repeat-containing N-terminal plant-type domain-containing protein n=1 Tax=Hibiscus syriacus TaxID=106335 RepID=A0A6A2WLX7_HIBSY|nr:hypothetical protein F3Y22_tig00116944pilonHSYRG00190 [Hibiscus syriacus]